MTPPDSADDSADSRHEPADDATRRALARVADLDDRVEAMGAALDALETTLQETLRATQDGPPEGPADESGDNGERLDMRILVAWVRDNVALLLERKMPQSGGFPHWCTTWWLHPEAIARFEALRRAWLEAAGQPSGAGLVVYFEHLDMQMGTLCGETGPFAGCSNGHNTSSGARMLGHLEPDESYYREVEAITAADSQALNSPPAGYAPPPADWGPPPGPLPGPFAGEVGDGGYARAGPPRGPLPPPNGHGPTPQRR